MLFELRTRPGPDPKHRLDASKIVETAKNLADDINTRLPGSSLAGLAEELTKVAVATRTRGRQAPAHPGHQGVIRPGDRPGSPGAMVSRPAHPHEVGVWYDQQHLRRAQYRVQSPGPPRRRSLVLRYPRGPDQAQGGLGVHRGAARVCPRHRRDPALLHPRPLPIPRRGPTWQPSHRRDLPALLHADARRDQQPGAAVHARGDRRLDPARPRRFRCSPWPSPRSTWPRPRPARVEGRKGSDMSQQVTAREQTSPLGCTDQN